MAGLNTAKTTFYPMAGSVNEQLKNLLQTLRWIDVNKPIPNDLYNWLRSSFKLSHYFARNVYSVILISSELVSVHDGSCYLTRDGRAVLDTASTVILLELFEKQFAGVAAILEVLRIHNKSEVKLLTARWFEIVKDRFPRMKTWSEKTLSNQYRHRINWLRAMGFVVTANRQCSLSESGWQFVITHPPEAIALQHHEIKKEEKHLREATLGGFQPFDPSAEKVQFLRKAFARGRAFRNIVTTQYEYRCAICSFRLKSPRGIYEAEAAHIIPRKMRGSDDPRNGICLCGTHHWAFDEGLLSISAIDFTVMTAAYLNEATVDESVQRILYLNGRHIQRVTNPIYAPSLEALDWHTKHIFLG